MDMNDNVHDMTMVNKSPFPIEFSVPSTTAPVAGVHTATVNESYCGKFLAGLDGVEAHVLETYTAPLVSGVPRKVCFALTVNVDVSKCIK